MAIKIVEESVVLVLNDRGNPTAMIRRHEEFKVPLMYSVASAGIQRVKEILAEIAKCGEPVDTGDNGVHMLGTPGGNLRG